MQAKDRARLRRRKQPVVEHPERPRAAAIGIAFLGRLEQHQHSARHLGAEAGEHLRDAESDGHVRVVAAGVFHVLDGRLVRHVDQLGNRQRVHVGADGDDPSWPSALQNAHDAGHADAGADFVESKRTQPVGDETGSSRLTVAELRVAVDVAPRLDDLRLE